MCEKRACKKCINDKYLYDTLKKDYGKLSICSYCSQHKKTISIEDIAHEISEGISTEYTECGMEYFNPQTGNYAISTDTTSELLLGIYSGDSDLVDDVCNIIDPDNNIGWYPKDDEYFGETENFNIEYNNLWGIFCNMVKYETRYVFFRQKNEEQNDKRSEILDFIGDAVDKLDLIKSIPPEYNFFRGRTYQSKDNAFSEDVELAAPPSKYAGINRMSAEGISLFYGANNVKTALAEIYNAQHAYATIVQFKNINPLYLLDISNIHRIKMPSIFDRKNRYKRKYIEFFRNFTKSITAPIDNIPAIEYVPTQILTEYFRHVYAYGCLVGGIAYPSSKNPTGKCYALFFNHDECLCNGQNQKLIMDKKTLQTYKFTSEKKYDKV